jgi:DNA-binding LytR/AlgR family response regulator
VLVVLLSSRMILYFTRIIRHLSMNWYRMWCVGEVVVCAFFVALYVALMGDFEQHYLDILVGTAGYLALTLVFPYIFLELAFCLAAARKVQAAPAERDNRLRFYDNRHALKFVVSAEHLLFIKADENYVTIHYNEGDNLKTYEMRCSMKSLEDICADNGILRCHRSYFINPAHVKALRKEKENMIVAEMDTAAETLIPVSKKYYDELVATL